MTAAGHAAGNSDGEQLRRPAAEEDGAAAEAVGEARETARHVGTPGQAPDLGAGNARVDRDRPGTFKPSMGRFCTCSGSTSRPASSTSMRRERDLVGVQEVLRKDRPEGTAADDDHIERRALGLRLGSLLARASSRPLQT